MVAQELLRRDPDRQAEAPSPPTGWRGVVSRLIAARS
jgi:hypothetical protein